MHSLPFGRFNTLPTDSRPPGTCTWPHKKATMTSNVDSLTCPGSTPQPTIAAGDSLSRLGRVHTYSTYCRLSHVRRTSRYSMTLQRTSTA
ncbi:hypothetical protein HBH53_043820 [Parastagonospora nodorum]|nr:hypothetical protein HBH53_043820 [Parastagonospora nodorum]KAH5073401.1 hypothetical protein HBH95_155110 [Parastagonospora nodorum]KAH5157761.1 hypothetical protein HBH69_073460 [Parastagonospora nodorum]KAH5334941.1 hypothetical protein HBI12_039200 [Parastagonospora nodorum]KAH6230074.1 hypothetical protein HBI43_045590 [Parastagonospora nodorum]